MPAWFFIVIGFLALAAVLGGAIIFNAKVNAKTRRLFAEMRRADAVAQSECMIRDGAMHCPGVAVIADATLIIRSVFDKQRDIPMRSVTVRREGPGLGRYPWWGKTVFCLDTPETTNLAIGVKDPEPWRKAFREFRAPGTPADRS